MVGDVAAYDCEDGGALVRCIVQDMTERLRADFH
jgi:hypothetical protein